MNKNTKRIAVRDLNANDRFYLPGVQTEYVCQSRRTMDNMTRVDYFIGTPAPLNTFTFAKVNLASVDLVVEWPVDRKVNRFTGFLGFSYRKFRKSAG